MAAHTPLSSLSLFLLVISSKLISTKVLARSRGVFFFAPPSYFPRLDVILALASDSAMTKRNRSNDGPEPPPEAPASLSHRRRNLTTITPGRGRSRGFHRLSIPPASPFYATHLRRCIARTHLASCDFLRRGNGRKTITVDNTQW